MSPGSVYDLAIGLLTIGGLLIAPSKATMRTIDIELIKTDKETSSTLSLFALAFCLLVIVFTREGRDNFNDFFRSIILYKFPGGAGLPFDTI